MASVVNSESDIKSVGLYGDSALPVLQVQAASSSTSDSEMNQLLDLESFNETRYPELSSGNLIMDVDGSCLSKDLLDLDAEFHKLLFGKPPKVLTRLVSAECSQIQRDEMTALKAIFEDELASDDEDTKCFKITVTDKSMVMLDDELLDLWFSIPVDYPNVLPIFELEGHGALSFEKADQLYNLLFDEASARLHETMIYDLITIAKAFIEKYVEERRNRWKERIPADGKTKETDDEHPGDANHVTSKNISHYYYERASASKYVGPIHKILGKIPKYLQIASIENVLRDDLAVRFEGRMDKMNMQYAHMARKKPESYRIEPTLGFHGTPHGNIPSIVQTGLQVPGGHSGVSIAHGSALGVGIYLATDPSISLSYCDDGGTILICSVLQGHIYKYVGSGLQSNQHKYDSVLSHDETVMVALTASQVLPCYVMRVVRKAYKDEDIVIEGALASKIAKSARKDETEEEKKHRLKMRAAKFLPYGFGPVSAKGRPVVIEDIADSSDDEEEYGGYQSFRYTDGNISQR